MDTTGGTCPRTAAPAAYVDAEACGSLDAALDAAHPGDTVRIRNGTYPGQRLSGAKNVTFIGESAKGVVFTGTVGLVGGVELRNFTSTNDAHAYAAVNPASDATIRNANLEGDYVQIDIRSVSNFRYVGGRLGDFDGTVQRRWCTEEDSEPVEIGKTSSASPPAAGVLIDGVTFSDFDYSRDGENGCAGDEFHLEVIRVDGQANDVTIRRNVFLDNHASSNTIFTSPADGGQPTGLKIAGNVFGSTPNAPILVPGGCTGYVLAYNTFKEGSFGSWTCPSYDGVKFVGNLGPRPASDTPACTAPGITWTANVTQAAFADSSCGGAWRQGADFTSNRLGLGPDGHLAAESPAIDAGEAPGAGALCGDASLGLDRDIDGDRRPAGARCDAGADERSG